MQLAMDESRRAPSPIDTGATRVAEGASRASASSSAVRLEGWSPPETAVGFMAQGVGFATSSQRFVVDYSALNQETDGVEE